MSARSRHRAEEAPLLSADEQAAGPDHDRVVPTSSESPTAEGLWPLIVVLITSSLWSFADFAPKAAAIDALRKFSCAEFYSLHPHPSLADMQAWTLRNGTVSGPLVGRATVSAAEFAKRAAMTLLAPRSLTLLNSHASATPAASPHSPSYFCTEGPNRTAIEAQTARYVLVTDTMNSLLTLLAIFYFGPRLSKWGRKPVLLISLSAIIVMQLGFLVLPIGYPYGPDVDELALHPVLTMYLIIGGYVISGLLGSESLPLVTFRTLVADHSTAARQTRNLTWLTLTYLGGVMFGPLLGGLLAELFPLTSGGIDAVLESRWWYWTKAQASEQPPVPTPHPVPPLPPGQADERNVTPFVVSITFAILALLFATFFVAESNPTKSATPAEAAASSSSSSAAAAATETTASSPQGPVSPRASLLSKLGPLRLLIPPETDGKRDWRYARLALVQTAGTSGGMGLTVLIVATGHVWGWDASSVGFMLSWIGGSRALVLFAVVPLLVRLVEKIVPKPVQLLGLSDAELERLAKGARPEDIGDASDEEEQAGATERMATSNTSQSEDRESDARLKPLVVLWRCAVDLSLARISFFTEMLGYIIISTAALFRNSPLMLIGTTFLSLGGGYAPAMQSACIALASDVFSSVSVDEGAEGIPSTERDIRKTASGAKKLGSADAALSAFSIIDTIVQTCVPIATTSLYAATNESFPPAPFLLITAFYAVAVTALTGLSPHRSHAPHLEHGH